MENNNSNGISVGVVVGFMLGLLVNVIFIPIAIGVGGIYDKVKNS